GPGSALHRPGRGITESPATGPALHDVASAASLVLSGPPSILGWTTTDGSERDRKTNRVAYSDFPWGSKKFRPFFQRLTGARAEHRIFLHPSGSFCSFDRPSDASTRGVDAVYFDRMGQKTSTFSPVAKLGHLGVTPGMPAKRATQVGRPSPRPASERLATGASCGAAP